MASLKGDIERILKALERDHNCTVTSNGGHYRVSRPGRRSITVSRTPSDQRAIRNVKGDVRKYLGVQL